eukprot:c51287_g1_i1 orf=37-210(+)
MNPHKPSKYYIPHLQPPTQQSTQAPNSKCSLPPLNIINSFFTNCLNGHQSLLINWHN